MQFVPGDTVPLSGVYRVEHRSHRLMHEATLLANRPFSPLQALRRRRSLQDGSHHGGYPGIAISVSCFSGRVHRFRLPGSGSQLTAPATRVGFLPSNHNVALAGHERR